MTNSNGVGAAYLRAHAWSALVVGWAWTVAASAVMLTAAAACERRRRSPPVAAAFSRSPAGR